MNEASHPSDYERSDADARLLAALAAGLAVFLIASPFVLGTLYPGALRPPGIPRDLPAPPAPRLQSAPKSDLIALRRRERQALETYGWVDRSAGIVHVPIDRAMDMLLERGLPGWRSGPAASPPAGH